MRHEIQTFTNQQTELFPRCVTWPYNFPQHMKRLSKKRPCIVYVIGKVGDWQARARRCDVMRATDATQPIKCPDTCQQTRDHQRPINASFSSIINCNPHFEALSFIQSHFAIQINRVLIICLRIKGLIRKLLVETRSSLWCWWWWWWWCWWWWWW